MKKIALAFSLLLIAGVVFGQDKMKSLKPLHLSFGADAGFPVLNSADKAKYRIVVGGDLQLEYDLTSQLSATASVGFEARLYKGGVVLTDYYVPVLGGLKYSFSDKWYITEKAGYSFKATKTIANGFTDVAGLGYKPSANTDIMAGWKGIFYTGGAKSFNTLVLRIAYNFGK